MTLASPATLMMSGACPPPAPSVWKAWIVRPFDRGDRVLDEAGLVQGIAVDHHLDVLGIRDRQAAIDRRRRRTPILVQLQRAGAGADLFDQRVRAAGIALAGEQQVHRQAFRRLKHAADVPGTWRAGGGVGAGRRPRAAADHGGDAAGEGFFHLLGADEVDMGIDAARGQDLAFAGDDLGAGPDDDVDAALDVGIARLADFRDAPACQADIGFQDAPMVDDHGVGDDGVDGALRARGLGLAHAVADHLAAAEFHLLAIGRAILLDLQHQGGIGQPQAIPDRGTKHVGIGASADLVLMARARRRAGP